MHINKIIILHQFWYLLVDLPTFICLLIISIDWSSYLINYVWLRLIQCFLFPFDWRKVLLASWSNSTFTDEFIVKKGLTLLVLVFHESNVGFVKMMICSTGDLTVECILRVVPLVRDRKWCVNVVRVHVWYRYILACVIRLDMWKRYMVWVIVKTVLFILEFCVIISQTG